MTRARLSVVAAVSGLVGMAGLTACDNPITGPDEPDPAETAQVSIDQLTAALTSKDLSAVIFDRAGNGSDAGVQVDATFDSITDQLSDYPVSVSGEVTSADDSAAAGTLHWVWDLGTGREWTYDTSVDLTPTVDAPEPVASTPSSSASNDAGSEPNLWTVTWSPNLIHPELRRGEVFDVDLLAAERGDIVGADGPIVTLRQVTRYGFNKAVVAKAKWAAQSARVAEAVGVEVAAFQAKVKAAGPEAFVEAIVYRKSDAAANVAGNFSQIPGALAIGDEIPLGPSRTFAAPILGSVGTATEADAAASKGTINPGDQIGTSGLQKTFDAELRGTAGIRIQAYKAAATRERTLVTFKPTAGDDLTISLNSRLQNLGEKVLAQVPTISALVAIKPSTGAIVTIANGAANAGFNTATAGRYPPGSTFKVVSSLALLRDGMTPTSTAACPATIDVGGRVFKNYSDYPASGLGTITMTRALANSCNTFFIGGASRLGDKDLGNAARALGLITEHDLGFDAYFGQVPVPTSGPVKGADMIGQGMVLSSPLGMATVAASIAKGDTVVPWLVSSRKDSAKPKNAITKAEASKIRQMMRTVVTSGTASVLADLPGEVMAKTGTAEYATSDENGTHAWMIAIDGDLAVAVLVEDGVSGSHTAGPLMRAFLADR